MRISEINSSSLKKTTNLEEGLNHIFKFIKDNNINPTDLEKQMIIDAYNMSIDDVKLQLKRMLKNLYSRYGKNYELELVQKKNIKLNKT
jgi:hypothetical protein